MNSMRLLPRMSVLTLALLLGANADHISAQAGSSDKSTEATDTSKLLQIIDASLKQKQYEDAYENAMKLVNAAPNVSSHLYLLGTAELMLRRNSDAIQTLSRSIDFKPNAFWAVVNRGVAKCYKNDLVGCEKDFATAISIREEQYPIYYNLGVLNIIRKNYYLAESQLSKAIAANPNFAEAYLSRSVARNEIGLKEEAKADLAKADQINPNAEDTLDFFIYLGFY